MSSHGKQRRFTIPMIWWFCIIGIGMGTRAFAVRGGTEMWFTSVFGGLFVTQVSRLGEIDLFCERESAHPPYTLISNT